MNKKGIAISAYLERIGFFGTPKVNLQDLEALVYNHLLCVPFENLDIHTGVPVELDYDKIYEKIVIRNRGGFCYELNGLFYCLLKAIGFDVSMISARVFKKNGSLSPEYNHLSLVVQLDQQMLLTDVGFGEFTVKPLLISTDKLLSDGRRSFRFAIEEDGRYNLYSYNNGEWAGEFNFELKHRPFHEFEEMCAFHQTDASSHFMKKPISTILTEDGRVTLAGNNLKIKSGINQITTEVEDELIPDLRRRYFGIM